MNRKGSRIKRPMVIGAVISLGLCLDLTSTAGIEQVRAAHKIFVEVAAVRQSELPRNPSSILMRPLDRAVIQTLHQISRDRRVAPLDTVKGIFIEGQPIYEGSGFYEKTHVQVAVCNPDCIKGVFRVPTAQLRSI